MKKFLKFLGVILLLVILFVLVAGLFIPQKYHFEKTIAINAPKEKIWNNISQFHNFQKWNPWVIKDSAMQKYIVGTDGTPGATYIWKGNKDAGAGSQTILEIVPFDHINLNIELKEPFEHTGGMRYNLLPEGNGYKMTWSFDTEFSYPWNAVAELFMNVDEKMDKDFSTGLINLKKLCENNNNYTTYKSETKTKSNYSEDVIFD